MLLALFLSFVATNFMHSYLLISQRREHKFAISFYAADSGWSHSIYILGHVLGGLFYLIFAYEFFHQQLDSDFLWVVSICGVVSEWIQALFPAKERYFNYHNFFAWSMAFFMSVLLIAAPIVYGLDGRGKAALALSILIFASCGLVTLKTKMQKFWIPQMIYFFSFYIVMAILAL